MYILFTYLLNIVSIVSISYQNRTSDIEASLTPVVHILQLHIFCWIFADSRRYNNRRQSCKLNAINRYGCHMTKQHNNGITHGQQRNIPRSNVMRNAVLLLQGTVMRLSSLRSHTLNGRRMLLGYSISINEVLLHILKRPLSADFHQSIETSINPMTKHL